MVTLPTTVTLTPLAIISDNTHDEILNFINAVDTQVADEGFTEALLRELLASLDKDNPMLVQSIVKQYVVCAHDRGDGSCMYYANKAPEAK